MPETISTLTELTAGQLDPVNDVLPIVDVSASQTKKVTVTNLVNDTVSSVVNGRATETDILANDDFLPIYDTSASTLDKALARNIQTPNSRNLLWFSDFLSTAVNTSGLQPFTNGNTAGGTVVETAANTDSTHVGVMQCHTGTTSNATAYAAITTNASVLVLGGGIWIFETVLRIDNLSGTPSYMVHAGFGNQTANAEHTEGVSFRYTHTENSGAWLGYTVSGGSTTTVNSAVTVAVDTWYKLRIEINAAGSSVEFFINGASIGTSSTNIPTSAIGVVPAKIRKTSSTTTQRNLFVDYAYVFHQLTTAR